METYLKINRSQLDRQKWNHMGTRIVQRIYLWINQVKSFGIYFPNMTSLWNLVLRVAPQLLHLFCTSSCFRRLRQTWLKSFFLLESIYTSTISSILMKEEPMMADTVANSAATFLQAMVCWKSKSAKLHFHSSFDHPSHSHWYRQNHLYLISMRYRQLR